MQLARPARSPTVLARKRVEHEHLGFIKSNTYTQAKYKTDQFSNKMQSLNARLDALIETLLQAKIPINYNFEQNPRLPELGSAEDVEDFFATNRGDKVSDNYIEQINSLLLAMHTECSYYCTHKDIFKNDTPQSDILHIKIDADAANIYVRDIAIRPCVNGVERDKLVCIIVYNLLLIATESTKYLNINTHLSEIHRIITDKFSDAIYVSGKTDLSGRYYIFKKRRNELTPTAKTLDIDKYITENEEEHSELTLITAIRLRADRFSRAPILNDIDSTQGDPNKRHSFRSTSSEQPSKKQRPEITQRKA
jgi:hypothetical protein